MDKKLKDKVLASLSQCLIYPETIDEKLWREAEIINQKILNLITEVIKS